MIATFLGMLEKGNDNALLRYSLGNAYFADKQFQPAVEHLQHAVQHDPNYSAAWKLLGRCHFELQQYEQALAVYEKGLRVAAEQGDKQAEKEMTVFQRRSTKALQQADESSTD
ncbi:MAG: tetratricopeptide repeat protein [Pseudomonadota bacterium]